MDNHKTSMIVLMETRCDPLRISTFIKRLGFDSIESSETNGFAGGMLVASIYARPNDTCKKDLWEALKVIAGSVIGAWMVAGDFNDIACIGDKKGGVSASLKRCNTMRNRMDACKFNDLEARGSRFTWRGPIFHGGQRIYEKLDRAISNDDWRILFHDAFVRVLMRVEFSDHHPILINLSETRYGSVTKCFRFENAWLMNDSYENLLRDTWKKDVTLTNYLQNVVEGITLWKFDSFDKVRRDKQIIIKRLDGIQCKLQRHDNYGGLRRLEAKLLNELSEILNKEELMWYQRSKTMWLSDGDRNTRYYHMRTIARRKRNKILMLKDINGDWITDQDDLKNHVTDFYKGLFASNNSWWSWKGSEICYPKLEVATVQELNKDISNDEVRKALFSMKPWKAPGTDGFPAGFYQRVWKVIREDLTKFVKDVWRNQIMISEINKTDICLIPKIDHPQTIAQFRPISLCNTIYKVISKVVEFRNNRWKPFQVGTNGVGITHLMFADDLLIFGEASEQQVMCVKNTLDVFCEMSGQEISEEKSSILFSDNVSKRLRTSLRNLSGFKETSGFGKYLGVPLTRKALKKNDFSYVMDQIYSKLTSWKARHLSFAGRLTLTKSVMEAIPICPMMTNLLPKACIKDIQKLQRNFLWGDTEVKKKHHVVSWDKIMLDKCDGGLGLRDLDIMNQTCIMKLGSKIINGDDDLWCKLLRTKYKVGPCRENLQARTSDSNLWKAIVKTQDNLRDIGVWQIGYGKEIRAWNDYWIAKDVCIEDCELEIPENLKNAHVKDLVGYDGNWDWELLSWLPNQTQLQIAALSPPKADSEEDGFLVANNEDGTFSIGNMYKYLRSANDTVMCKTWKTIWKLQVQERVRCFIWLINHERLLTNFRMHTLGLSNGECHLCGQVCETELHILRDCKFASRVWTNRVPVKIANEFYNTNLKDWIDLNIMSGAQVGEDWCNYWAVGCHTLWEWRNKDLHMENFSRPIEEGKVINDRVKDYKAAIMLNTKVMNRCYDELEIFWNKLRRGFLKLNSDGAYGSDGLSGCGGCVCDDSGVWIMGFSKFIDLSSPLKAKLWGILIGITLAHQHGYLKLEIESDSQMVVNLVINGRLKNRGNCSLVRQIVAWMDKFEVVKIHHVFREANKCAHLLAMEGSYGREETIEGRGCFP
ncbi:uncharacterized protein LOC131632954 [Vicia villosa]|uniref:uncharacterized protein LOC131632954 n=1 Tax=Vicia villosa TaxID=3911 RepID=UPI00273C95A3|nr:uncharacterized protein LOC131632954 [Vicia villosa]